MAPVTPSTPVYRLQLVINCVDKATKQT